MGLGDWIISTAEARHYHEVYERPVVFANKKTKRVFWSEVFENNPKIIKDPQPGQDVVVVENYPGNRPYIKQVTTERYYYNPNFIIERGEIFLTEEEQKGIPGAVIVEPHTKTEMGLSRNKAWPWERWQELVNTLNLPWVQLGPSGTRALDGVQFIETPRFRDALGYVKASALVVTTDGALHHAAAAFEKDAVVLWGGVAGPDILGYRTHKNLRAEVETCGSLKDCPHCKEAMERITLNMVADEVLRLSQRQSSTGRGP